MTNGKTEWRTVPVEPTEEWVSSLCTLGWSSAYKTDATMRKHNERLIRDVLAAAPTPTKSEPAKYEFQDRDGTWHPFIDERNFRNTVQDGSWPIRALYTEPQGQCDRNAVIEECWQAIEEIDDGESPEYRACQEAIRAMKSQPVCGGENCTEVCQACAQPAAPDTRDELIKRQAEALRVARAIIERHHAENLRQTNAMKKANSTCADFKGSPLRSLIESGYMAGLGKDTDKALAAIDDALTNGGSDEA